MAVALRQSTASQEIYLGVFVDEVDGYTPETGLTPANTDIKLGLAGGTTLTNKASGGATHISGGIYSAVLDATDTGTLGPLMIFVKVAGARFVSLECHVYPAIVFDSLFATAGTDYLQVDSTQVAGSTTAATRQSNLLLGAINSTTVAASPAPTTTQFAGGLVGASYPDQAFRGGAIVFTGGSNASLSPRIVTGFTSSSGLFVVSPALPFVPTAADPFMIVGTSS
jgi:hypothetical protein